MYISLSWHLFYHQSFKQKRNRKRKRRSFYNATPPFPPQLKPSATVKTQLLSSSPPLKKQFAASLSVKSLASHNSF
ncbi:hypothetical protein P8452_43215 [Trifolium repens]|nr:hypothetical protein P8452_43215 [Trifolium repens]